MIRKSFDLILIITLTLIAVGFVQSGIHNFLRVLFVLPLIFVFPGYAVVAAMFSQSAFHIETQLVFAIALSVALTVMTGLMLHFTPRGLQTESWLLVLTTITLLSSLIAIIRRRASFTYNPVNFSLNFRWSELTLLGLAAVLTFAAIGVARNGVVTQPRSGFTQLWMLPSSSHTPNTVDLGIHNEEINPVSYHLVISQGNTILDEWKSVELAPGEQWQAQMTLPSSGASIEAQLYRNDFPDSVYRSVSFALNHSTSTKP